MKKFIINWRKETIFKKGIIDCMIYVLLYIIIPVTITYFSFKSAFLKLDVNDSTKFSFVYCYLSLLISCAGSLYDIINRWQSGVKTINNLKLALMGLPVVIIIIYCTIQIIAYVSGEGDNERCDYILLSYGFTVLIVAIETIILFINNISTKSSLKGKVQDLYLCGYLKNKKNRIYKLILGKAKENKYVFAYEIKPKLLKNEKEIIIEAKTKDDGGWFENYPKDTIWLNSPKLCSVERLTYQNSENKDKIWKGLKIN